MNRYFLVTIITILIFIIYKWLSLLWENNNSSPIIYKNYILGFLLFLVTELMIFISVFWSWFHMSLIPCAPFGAIWPFYGFPHIHWSGIALYNTSILFISSCFINYWEVSIKTKITKYHNLPFLLWTILLGIHFLLIQCIEYSRLGITINDSIISVLFYSITGLHLIHVIIGLIFLIISFLRQKFSLPKNKYVSFHTQFKVTCFYWHFVDIMWILVFLVVYVI